LQNIQTNSDALVAAAHDADDADADAKILV